MIEPEDLEVTYQEYVSDLKRFIPDGIIDVDLSLLQELNLLKSDDSFEGDLAHSFFVVESTEKLTLFNDQFVVWIVPKLVDQKPTTLTLIALNSPKNSMHLDMAFSATGVYNHSGLVLRILEKFLDQIQENEKEICKFNQG